MTSTLNPYLLFTGNAREAMEFYQRALGGELTITTYGEYGDAHSPEAHQVMHAQLRTEQGWVLMGADQPEQVPLHRGDDVVVSLSGNDPELRDAFAALAQGGKVVTPLERQAWGDEYGLLVDRFGTGWMVNLAAEEA